MKMIKILAFLFSLLGLINSQSFAEEKEYYLKLVSETYDLNYYRENSLHNHIFGVYREYLALTGGKYIHLFPDGNFIITTFCDICPEETIAQGTFSFSDGIVKFDYLKLSTKYSDLKESINNLHAFWGWIDKGTYVTGHITILVNPDKLIYLSKDKQFFDFYERVESYEQWRKIEESLSEKK